MEHTRTSLDTHKIEFLEEILKKISVTKVPKKSELNGLAIFFNDEEEEIKKHKGAYVNINSKKKSLQFYRLIIQNPQKEIVDNLSKYSEYKNLELEDCHIAEDLDISKLEIVSILLKNCVFDKTFKIENNENKYSSFEFYQCTFKGKLIIQHLQHIGTFMLGECLIEKTSYIHAESIGRLILGDSDIKNLTIGKPQPEQYGTRFENTLINILRLTERFSGNLKISKSKISHLEVKRLNNKGFILFDQISFIKSKRKKENSYEETTFWITESSVRNLELVGFNMQKLDNFVLLNSNISEMVVNSTVWNTNLTRWKSQSDSDLKDSYRQLKLLCSRQHDVVNSLEFHKKEVEIYAKSKSIEKNWGDKFILKCSQLSSDFGTSWGRAVLFYLVFGFLFMNLGFLFASINPLEIGIAEYIKKYFQFLSLLDAEKIVSKDNSPYFYITVYIWRILASYLAYQIIVASRKFNKKF